MTERRKQTDFLRQLMSAYDCARSRDLQSRIAQAERDERCTYRATLLASLLAGFSLAGLCYSAVFVPEFFQHRPSTTVWFFTAFLFTSGICVVSFGLFWCWYRNVSNALYQEGRGFIIAQQRAPQTNAGAPGTEAPSSSSNFLANPLFDRLPRSSQA